MRTYETIFIVHPEAVGDGLTAVLDKFRQILAEQGATVFKLESWGARTLAYPVKKQNKGTYVQAVFEGQPSIITEFERRMRIDDNVIKFQTVQLEEGYNVPVAAAAAAEETASAVEEAAPADEGADA